MIDLAKLRLLAWDMDVSVREVVLDAADEIERLRAEVKRLRAGGCTRGQRTTQWCAEAVALRAEVEALRADAERLNWLDSTFPLRVAIGRTDLSGWCVFGDSGGLVSNAATIRAAIDAARKA